MPRKQPSERVDLLGKPDSTPLFDVSEFIESCIMTKVFNDIKAPVWDSAGDSIEDFYVTARLERELKEREKEMLLQQRRIENVRNANRIRRFNYTHAKLRSRFVSVNEFLREFTDKRKMALKKGEEQLKLQGQLRNSNRKIKKDINEVLEFRKKIKATSDEYEPYERVLDEVLRESPGFNTLKELMDRCDALMIAQVEISELSDKNIDELESMRKRLVDVANTAALQVLGFKNVLSSLEHLYESARYECLKWERTLGMAKKEVNINVLKKERVRDTIDYLYRLICQRRSVYADLPYDAIEERLDFIQDEAELLRDVLKTFQRKRRN